MDCEFLSKKIKDLQIISASLNFLAVFLPPLNKRLERRKKTNSLEQKLDE